MNSANQVTLAMLLLAAVSTVGAVWYYPWPEIAVADEEVGKPLFEEYSADKVRGIDIVELDAESRTPARIQLGRRAEKWVVPSRQNFIASNSALVAKVVNSLNDRTVYDVKSENMQDHIQFGVVDPDEFSVSQNLEAVGKKLTLTDRNSKTIAELIIGTQVKGNADRHYVRIPGKPRIYEIDFSDEILKTPFTYWVNPNPLQLKTSSDQPGFNIFAMRLKKNKPASGDGKSGAAPVYDAQMSAGKQRLELNALSVPASSEKQAWKKVRTKPEQEARLGTAFRGLFPFPTDDVRRKKKEPARALRNQVAKDKTAFDKFSSYGFYSPEWTESGWTFQAENGSVSLSTREGVVITLSFGKTGNQNSMSKARFNHFTMITAGVDHELLKEPIRPDGLADDDSEANKKFRRLLDGWQEAVKGAQRMADDLNAVHSDWFYLVSEDVVKRLLPDLEIAAASADVEEQVAVDPRPTDQAPKPNSDDNSAQTPNGSDPVKPENEDGGGANSQDKEPVVDKD